MLLSARHTYFPYCLDQLPDKTWVVLNRNYKPLGVSDSVWADYESIPKAQRIAKISKSQAAKIDYSGEWEAGQRIYLYNDGCVPTDSKKHMDAYLGRLAVLMTLKTCDDAKR